MAVDKNITADFTALSTLSVTIISENAGTVALSEELYFYKPNTNVNLITT